MQCHAGSTGYSGYAKTIILSIDCCVAQSTDSCFVTANICMVFHLCFVHVFCAVLIWHPLAYCCSVNAQLKASEILQCFMFLLGKTNAL